MASGKELRTKIKSVENTKKITKAMEMMATTKLPPSFKQFHNLMM